MRRGFSTCWQNSMNLKLCYGQYGSSGTKRYVINLTVSQLAVFMALQILYEWLTAKGKEEYRSENVLNKACCNRWQKPALNFYKCDVDAAVFNDRKSTGIGMVLRMKMESL